MRGLRKRVRQVVRGERRRRQDEKRAKRDRQQSEQAEVAQPPRARDDVLVHRPVGHFRDRGWAIAAVDPAAGTLEATATTRFFRFKDDVVVRVRPDPASAGGSIVDMRSISRVGGSDVGVNAARVRVHVGPPVEAGSLGMGRPAGAVVHVAVRSSDTFLSSDGMAILTDYRLTVVDGRAFPGR